jgi:predicted phosphodiesterase
MSVARREDVHAILTDDSVSDFFASQLITDMVREEISEAEVRRYRKLSKPDFLRANPYPEGTTPLAPAPVRKKQAIPQWAGTPGFEVDGDEGTIYTRPRVVVAADEGEHDDAEELREFGFNPEVWEVAWAKRSNWQAQNGDWLESRKLTVRKRDSRRLQLENVSEVFAAYTTPEESSRAKTDRTVVVAFGDTQVGKVDGGGSESLVARYARIITDIAAWLRSTGGCDRLLIVNAGDCIEGVVSQNGRLITRLDLSVTEQVRLCARMIMHSVGVFAPLCNQMLNVYVPGNHDEPHRVAATKPSDSWAVQAASSVADAIDLMGGYEHVEWLFPKEEQLTATVSIGTEEHPFTVTAAHGHVPGRANQMISWWAGQAHGRLAPGEADLLITGHLHHLRIENTGGGKTWLQVPAMDGGSLWFTSKSGDNVPSGIVTFEVDPSRAPGWENLKVWS